MGWADKAYRKYLEEKQRQQIKSKVAQEMKEEIAQQIRDTLMKDEDLTEKVNQYGERMKQDIRDENTVDCLTLFYSCTAVALHEQHRFGQKRILKLFQRIDELFGDAENTLKRCEEDIGITIDVK